jgi:hypothetical protein
MGLEWRGCTDRLEKVQLHCIEVRKDGIDHRPLVQPGSPSNCEPCSLSQGLQRRDLAREIRAVGILRRIRKRYEESFEPFAEVVEPAVDPVVSNVGSLVSRLQNLQAPVRDPPPRVATRVDLMIGG